MKLAELYRMLCRLYEPNIMVDINRYLLLRTISGTTSVVGNRIMDREALFIRESEGCIELGLFIAPNIVAALEATNPIDRLEELAYAAEGVSHFLYVSDRACANRSVSRLELELQAEVDKFLILHLTTAAHARGTSPELFSRQFEQHHYDPRLNDEECERYTTASHFAAKYCHHLREYYFNPLRLAALQPAVRDFFRRDLAGKLKMLIP